MNIKEKFENIAEAMEVKKRADESEYTCFSDKADERLKSIFLEHYEVRNLDYKIFSNACDVIADLTLEQLQGENDDSFDIYDVTDNQASYYNSDRLEYLNIWNEEEIADKVRQYECSISEACAYWYDEQVRDAVSIIRDYIFEK